VVSFRCDEIMPSELNETRALLLLFLFLYAFPVFHISILVIQTWVSRAAGRLHFKHEQILGRPWLGFGSNGQKYLYTLRIRLVPHSRNIRKPPKVLQAGSLFEEQFHLLFSEAAAARDGVSRGCK